jgi:hypothetical protein
MCVATDALESAALYSRSADVTVLPGVTVDGHLPEVVPGSSEMGLAFRQTFLERASLEYLWA